MVECFAFASAEYFAFHGHGLSLLAESTAAGSSDSCCSHWSLRILPTLVEVFLLKISYRPLN